MKKNNVFINNEMEVLLITLYRFDVREREFSILEEKDESVCLDRLEDNWVTYYSEKNNKSNYKTHKTFYEACDAMFKAFADTKEEQRAMKKFYDVLIIQLNEAGVELELAENYVIDNESVEKDTEKDKIRILN